MPPNRRPAHPDRAADVFRQSDAQDRPENDRVRQSDAQDRPLPGFLRPEYRDCGKPGCRCQTGRLHGPYWYRRWREAGRQRRAYVQSADLPRVRAAVDEWNRLHPPLWPIRRLLRDLARLHRAAGGLR